MANSKEDEREGLGKELYAFRHKGKPKLGLRPRKANDRLRNGDSWPARLPSLPFSLAHFPVSEMRCGCFAGEKLSQRRKALYNRVESELLSGVCAVPITVECSSCQSRYFLQPDLIGKSMRCPACKEIFTVQELNSSPPQVPVELPAPPATTGTATPRADAPAPKYRSGSVADFMPILDSTAEVSVEPVLHLSAPDEPMFPDEIPLLVEPLVLTDFEVVEEPVKAAPPQSPVRKPTAIPTKVGRTSSPVVVVEEAEIVEPSLPEPKEIVWSEHAPEPPSPQEIVWSPSAPDPFDREDEPEPDESPRYDDEYEADDFPQPRRKKRSRLALLVVGILAIIGALGGGGLWLKKHLANQPSTLFAKGQEEYGKKNYEPARKLFQEIVDKHKDFPQLDEAKFMMELSSFRLAIFSVTVSSDPTVALQKLSQFVVFTQEPSMQPFSERFKPDIWDSIKKLSEDTFQKSKDVFNLDHPEESEEWLNTAAALETLEKQYRPAEIGAERAAIYAEMEQYRTTIQKAHERQEFLAWAKEHLADPDDAPIVEVRVKAKEAGLEKDSAVEALLSQAEKTIQGRWVYRRFPEPIAPTRLRGSGTTGLLFVPRIDLRNGDRLPPLPGPTAVFFALARGVLYALDENDGHVLWATRVGLDSDALPTRVPASDLNPELVLVAVNDGNRSSLTARVARTGESLWHQPLPAPCLGQPIVVGQRVFVPTRDKPPEAGQPIRRDEKGAVFEFEIRDGFLLGKLALGRPLGTGGVRRPGSGLLFFPAESRGVYVFDVEKLDTDGKRLDPVLVGILNSEHPAGTLRAEPVLTNTETDAPGPRYLILNQADGLNEMKLRAFPFPPAESPQVPTPNAVEIGLIGWSWFPAFCDSEKLAIVTDRGEFGLFGINQDRNNDSSLFVIPPEVYRVADARRPARGQVVYADESSFWILARGQLQNIRIGFDAMRGLSLVPRGKPLTLGEPLHPAQSNLRGDNVMVVTQSENSSSCMATTFDPQTGQIRWQRQLGLIIQGSPLHLGEAIVLADQDAGIYRIDPASLLKPTNAEWVIDDAWLVAPPLSNITAPPIRLLLPDGKSMLLVASMWDGTETRLIVRRYSLETGVQESSALLPAALAGDPIIVGDSLVVPLATGLLHRLKLSNGRTLEEGPTWRAPRIDAAAKCRLLAFRNDEFFATDGSRTLHRWRWPQDQDLFDPRGQIVLSEKIAGLPLLLPDATQPRVLLADTKGNITLWDAEKTNGSVQPLRTWRPSPKGPIPPGTITAGPFMEADTAGKISVLYIVDGLQLIALSPDKDGPAWVSPIPPRTPGDGILGRPQWDQDRYYLTERNGRFRTVNAKTGQLQGEVYQIQGTEAAASAALPIRGKRLLAPLTDGTILLAPLTVEPTKPPFLFIPVGPFVPFIPIPWSDG